MAEALDILLPVVVFLVCAWMQHRKREHRRARKAQTETSQTTTAELEALAALTGGVFVNNAVYVRTPEKNPTSCHGCVAFPNPFYRGSKEHFLCKQLRTSGDCINSHMIWKRIELPPSLKR